MYMSQGEDKEDSNIPEQKKQQDEIREENKTVDKNTTEESHSEGKSQDENFFVKIAKVVGNDKLIEIAEDYAKGQKGQEFIPGSGSLREPSNDNVIREGLKNLIREKQKEVAIEEGIDDHREIEVDLDVGDPNELIEDFDTLLYSVSDELVRYLEKHSIFDNDSPTLDDESIELTTYIIQKNRDNNVVIIGGAECVRKNLILGDDDFNVNEDEEALIKHVHNQAARENGFNAHLLMDDVLFLPVRGEKIN